MGVRRRRETAGRPEQGTSPRCSLGFPPPPPDARSSGAPPTLPSPKRGGGRSTQRAEEAPGTALVSSGAACGRGPPQPEARRDQGGRRLRRPLGACAKHSGGQCAASLSETRAFPENHPGTRSPARRAPPAHSPGPPGSPRACEGHRAPPAGGQAPPLPGVPQRVRGTRHSPCLSCSPGV